MNNRKNNGFVSKSISVSVDYCSGCDRIPVLFAGNGVGQSQQINYTELVKEIKMTM